MSAPLVKRSDRLAVAVLRLRRELVQKDATIAALLTILDSCDTPLLLAAIHGFHTSAEVSERNAAIIAGARALLAPAPREGA